MADNPSFSSPVSVSTPDTIVYTDRYETNSTTGAVKLVTEALNVTQNSVSYLDPDDGSAYTPTGTVANEPIRISLGKESVDLADLSHSTLTAGAGLTVPAGANHAELHVFDADGIVYTLDGTKAAGVSGAPTTGFRINSGGSFELESADEMGNFLANSLNAGPDASVTGALYVEYFNFGDSWSGLSD